VGAWATDEVTPLEEGSDGAHPSSRIRFKGMQVPLEISYHHLDRSEAVDALIREKAEHLEKFCDHITSCRVIIDQPQKHQSSGNPYRVQLDITIPPGHELAVEEGGGGHEMHEPLQK